VDRPHSTGAQPGLAVPLGAGPGLKPNSICVLRGSLKLPPPEGEDGEMNSPQRGRKADPSPPFANGASGFGMTAGMAKVVPLSLSDIAALSWASGRCTDVLATVIYCEGATGSGWCCNVQVCCRTWLVHTRMPWRQGRLRLRLGGTQT
jgi:hypothetical protein